MELRFQGGTSSIQNMHKAKAFMKKICYENNIPTAKFKICKNFIQVKEFIQNSSLPIVVKADGLAAGKGEAIGLCVKTQSLFAVI